MRQLCLLLAGTFLLSGSVFAQDAGPFSSAPAPTQEYHAATTKASTSASQTVPQADLVGNTTPAAAVVAAPQPLAVAPAVVAPQPAPVGNATLNSAGIDTGLQGQLSQLTQSTLTFEQQADQRIQNLVDSNQAIGVTLRTMTQNIAMLQQQMSQLPSTGSVSGRSESFYGVTLNQEELNGVMIGAGAMLLLMLGALFGRYTHQRARVSAHSQMPSTKEQEAEYDFMGTPEAIPAKLDLARSYMAMNDIDQAKAILKTVIERGNDAERAEAGLLFQKIIKK